MLKALAAKYVASWTARVATALMASGVVVTVDPTLLSHVPEQWRGPTVTILGTVVLLARLRKELGL
jgi:hypothetical protein